MTARFVEYMLDHGPNDGQVRPALVVAEDDDGNPTDLAVFTTRADQLTPTGVLNLHVGAPAETPQAAPSDDDLDAPSEAHDPAAEADEASQPPEPADDGDPEEDEDTDEDGE